MAAVRVSLPVGVRLPGMPESIECNGDTVAEVLTDCTIKEPRLKFRIFHRDGSPGVGVSLNGAGIPPDQAAKVVVADGDAIKLLPAVGAC